MLIESGFGSEEASQCHTFRQKRTNVRTYKDKESWAYAFSISPDRPKGTE